MLIKLQASKNSTKNNFETNEEILKEYHISRIKTKNYWWSNIRIMIIIIIIIIITITIIIIVMIITIVIKICNNRISKNN